MYLGQESGDVAADASGLGIPQPGFRVDVELFGLVRKRTRPIDLIPTFPGKLDPMRLVYAPLIHRGTPLLPSNAPDFLFQLKESLLNLDQITVNVGHLLFRKELSCGLSPGGVNQPTDVVA
jgi:hypothetical protein